MTKGQRLSLALFILCTVIGVQFMFSTTFVLATLVWMGVSGIAGAYFVLGDGKQD